jgi:hypothetical protein
MSAKITLAIEKSTGRMTHINEAAKSSKFISVSNGKELIPVKSQARKKDWHFRQKEDSFYNDDRDLALHRYIVQIIMENCAINISDDLRLNYTEPRKEVAIFGKRSDVTVRYNGEEVHFEVVVTHDLDIEKINVYKHNKIKCVRMDFSDPQLLNAQPEKIRDEVLNNYKNKSIIYWQDEKVIEYIPESTYFNWNTLFVFVIVGLLIKYLIPFSIKRKRRHKRVSYSRQRYSNLELLKNHYPFKNKKKIKYSYTF